MKQQPMARKLLALCLSLLLVLALSPTAWADPTEGGETPPTNEAPAETAPANTAPAEEETTTTNETLEEKCVALIGEDEYTDLAKAFEDAAESGATITLVSDVTLEETIKLTSGEVTLDLSEKTISGSASTLFELSGGAKLTVDNGTITAGKDAFSVYGDQTFAQANPVNTKLTLGSGLMVTSGSNCVYIRGASAQADIYAKLSSTSTEYAVIQGNGTHNESLNQNYGGTIVNIYDPAEIIQNGGSNVVAIYQPQNGELNISGGLIRGGDGIGIKSGKLNISGGTIEATGEYVPDVAAWSNGINQSGSAILIETNEDYASGVELNITGGTLKSQNANAVREFGETKNIADIQVSGSATFESAEDKADIVHESDNTVTVEVTDGTFSNALMDSSFIAGDALIVETDDDGRYYIGDAAETAVTNAKDTVTVHNGKEITDVPANVTVTNKTNDSITVNGETVLKDGETTIPEPEQPSKPSTPSFTEPEYYPDYDEDVDYLPPVDEEKPEETEDLYMVTCRTLNVRLGGGTGYARIGTLSRGTILEGELENGWLKFPYNGQTAYCSADYLARVDGDLSGLHVTCRTLNVRAGAGTNFEILGTLSRGTEVEILDVLNGWYKIEYLGGEAYVSAAYIG